MDRAVWIQELISLLVLSVSVFIVSYYTKLPCYISMVTIKNAYLHFSAFLCISLHFSESLCNSLHFSAFLYIFHISLHFLNFSAFLYISLHFSKFLCIFLHFSAFHCIPLHLSVFEMHFSVFCCISLHFSAFHCISLHFYEFLCILHLRTIWRSVPLSYGHHFYCNHCMIVASVPSKLDIDI